MTYTWTHSSSSSSSSSSNSSSSSGAAAAAVTAEMAIEGVTLGGVLAGTGRRSRRRRVVTLVLVVLVPPAIHRYTHRNKHRERDRRGPSGPVRFFRESDELGGHSHNAPSSEKIRVLEKKYARPNVGQVDCADGARCRPSGIEQRLHAAESEFGGNVDPNRFGGFRN